MDWPGAGGRSVVGSLTAVRLAGLVEQDTGEGRQGGRLPVLRPLSTLSALSLVTARRSAPQF